MAGSAGWRRYPTHILQKRFNTNESATLVDPEYVHLKKSKAESFQAVLDLSPPLALFQWSSVSNIKMLDLNA